MKKILYVILFGALPALAVAQVDKRVEVTKDYVPNVVRAEKLPVVPDMVDTVALRPDIDYTITPLSMATRLTTEPIRPATVTYWEFNRPKTFYLKAGTGYPLNSVFDFYGSTQHPGTGYLLGYINHQGMYGSLPRRDLAWEPYVRKVDNRAGFSAGKYLGRHLLEGEFSYDNRYYDERYYTTTSTFEELHKLGWNYGTFGVHVRLGDNFTDLSRLNFNVGLRGTLFNSSEFSTEPIAKPRQSYLGVDGTLARRFGKHTLRLDVTYEHGSGVRDIVDYRQDILKAGLRYGLDNRTLGLEVGADYWYDERAGRATKHYVTPAVGLRVNLDTKAFSPFFEADGRLRDNSPRTLARENPYLSSYMWSDPKASEVLNILQYTRPLGYSAPLDYTFDSSYETHEPDNSALWCNKSTVYYNFRLGAEGAVAGGRFTYRLFGEISVVKNQIYWARLFHYFLPLQGDQTVSSIHAEVEYKPISRLMLGLGVHGYSYDDRTVIETRFGNQSLEGSMPKFKAAAFARYTAPKFSFGVRVDMQGRREWLKSLGVPTSGYIPFFLVKAPFAADLSADVDWRILRWLSVFGEVHNIANMEVYDYPFFRDYGTNFTVGVKMVF